MTAGDSLSVQATNGPRLSACLIAKNERANVRPCLASFWDHVDEVVFVDTGSRDGTVAEVRRFASEQDDPSKLVLGRFKWCDDFAAARNQAIALATGEWLINCDLDEEIIGAGHLRELASGARERVAGFIFTGDYDCAVEEFASMAPRLQLVRRAGARWEGRLHENLVADGEEQVVPPERVIWRHRLHDGASARRTRETMRLKAERNLRVAERWHAEEANNARCIRHLSALYILVGKHGQAVDACRKYLALPGIDRLLRAQMYDRLVLSLSTLGKDDEAREAARAGLAEIPLFARVAGDLTEGALNRLGRCYGVGHGAAAAAEGARRVWPRAGV